MTKKRLPLDPFDPATPLSADYQIGNLAWAVLLISVAGGLFLFANADFDGWVGWTKVVIGIALIAGGAWLARLLSRQI